MERSVQILTRLSEVLSATPRLEEALNEALQLLAELVELESGWVWLKAVDGEGHYLAASLSLPDALLSPEQMTGGSCHCLDGVRKGELPCDRVTVIECSRLRDRSKRVRYHATLPLVFDGRPLGLINLAGPDWRRLSEEESRWLDLAARQIGLAVERAQLAELQLGRVREQERLRLARDIHDHLAQGFTAIAYQSESALAEAGASRAQLERILELAREGLEQARTSVAELRRGPPLSHRLREQLQSFTYRTGVPVRTQLAPELRLAPFQEEELLALVKEGLSNIERHSRARRVRCKVEVVDDLLELTLHDDGVGFETAARPPAGHYGLRGMKERAELAGAQLQLESVLGEGTQITVWLPLGESTES